MFEGLKFFRSWASHRLGGPLGSIMNPQTTDGQEGEHQEGGGSYNKMRRCDSRMNDFRRIHAV